MQIPSVTQVLSPWSKYDAIPPEVLQAAQERGIRVHGACFAICLGLWSPPIPEEWQGYVKSFRWWLENAVAEIILVEPELRSAPPNPQFEGHPDLVVRMVGESYLSLADLKTPVNHFKSWAVQCAAYKKLCLDNGYEVRRIFSLRIAKDGSPPKANDYTGSYEFDLGIFLNALACWRYFNE